MSDECHFQAQLDACDGDSAARLLLAEFYGERGDWRAGGYRFMAERGRWPYTNAPACPWLWVEHSDRHYELAQSQPFLGIPLNCSLPVTVMNSMRAAHGRSVNAPWWFRFRLEAEEALCRAVSFNSAQSSPTR